MWYLKFKTFINSLYFHIARGLPKATQNEINVRYNICINCEEYNHVKTECSVCGCFISDKKIFLNKLAWADQSCPKNKWSSIRR